MYDSSQVGIFWRIVTAKTGPILLVDSVRVAEAEPYGDSTRGEIGADYD